MLEQILDKNKLVLSSIMAVGMIGCGSGYTSSSPSSSYSTTKDYDKGDHYREKESKDKPDKEKGHWECPKQ